MLATIKRILRLDSGRSNAPRPRRMVIRGRYDAAQTTDNNRRHWTHADGLSANATNTAAVRRTLRNRCRYEVANNSYARGIVLTLANDCVGTGPRLQMLSEDEETNNRIERVFGQWSMAVRLAEKLRTLRIAKAEDGEAFALLYSNPQLDHAVSLDLRAIEADQVSTPRFELGTRNAVDGIVFDEWGNPTEYHVLPRHPGDSAGPLSADFVRVPASAMLHYYRADRPEQARGIPELTPALPLFAMLREYTLATLDAAKAAAYVSGVLYTDAPPNGETADVDTLDKIELERNTLLTMPGGWKMGQVHAEQPTSSFKDFKNEILGEVARALNMPFNIAAGNSSGYNYASGRLDHQTYFKAIRVEHSHINSVVMDRIFQTWLKQAVRIKGFLPPAARHDDFEPVHQWFWDGFDHVDPQKEAKAQATRLENHTTTLAEEYAKKGRDWESELRQRAKEVALITELGLSALPSDPAAVPVAVDPGDAADETESAD